MNPLHFIRRAVLLCALGSSAISAVPAFGKDTWSDPFAGVRLLHRSIDDPKWDFHLAVVDLSEPGTRLTVTPPEDRRSTVSSFAKKKKVQLAVNGDFFSYKDYSVGGLAVGEGKLWPDSDKDTKSSGFLAAGPGRVELYEPSLVVPVEPWMQNVVSGKPMLVHDGKGCGADSGVAGPRHPRTAVGLSKDRKTLFVLVVDGRQKHSVGMTGKEMEKVFLEFGAWDALNLDGGGSSSMFVEGSGVVNKPSDGRERVDGNHFGVYAPPAAPRAKGLVKGTVKDKATGQPLAGAKVSLSAAYADGTTATGYYELSEVPAGSAQIAVTLDGYEPARPRVKVEAQKAVVLDVELAPKAAPPAKTTETVSAAAPGARGSGDAGAAKPAAVSGGEDADRLLEKGGNYERANIWGKALEAYQEVVKQFPGTAQAGTAEERIRDLEKRLGEAKN